MFDYFNKIKCWYRGTKYHQHIERVYNTQFLKYIVVYEIGMFLLPSLVTIWLIMNDLLLDYFTYAVAIPYFVTASLLLWMFRDRFRILNKERPLTWKLVLTIFILGLGFLAVNAVISNLIEYLSKYLPETPYNEVTSNQEWFEWLLKRNPKLMFITTAFFGPIAEELAFREALFNLFKNKKVGRIITTATFATLHVATFTWESLLWLPAYVLLGWIFMRVYEKTDGDLRVTIGMHMINNFVAGIIELFL